MPGDSRVMQEALPSPLARFKPSNPSTFRTSNAVDSQTALTFHISAHDNLVAPMTHPFFLKPDYTHTHEDVINEGEREERRNEKGSKKESVQERCVCV